MIRSEIARNLSIALIFVVLLVVVISCISYTPKINNDNGISEFREIEIGDVLQTILIRGNDQTNPILLYLHGGPGTTELIPFRMFQSDLENYFTVVTWEQRGTGKSFSPKIPLETMTIDQFIHDTHELTNYLLKEFNQDKLLIVGHSWGSALGLLVVSKYPELYFAYVGSGQMVNQKEGENISYQHLITVARENKKAYDELISLNKPEPYLAIDENDIWFEKIKVHRKWLVRLGGEIHNQYDYSLLFNLKTFLAPEYTLFDFIRFGRGSIFSLKTMWPQIMELDFFLQIPEIKLPVFFLQGRHDYNTPSTLVDSYYNQIVAPEKFLIWFENSGHHPMYEEPEKYSKFLIENVLPRTK